MLPQLNYKDKDMEDKVKELVELLKKERRTMILHFMPGDEDSKGNDYCGIQWGSNTTDVFSEQYNSFPKEVQVKAMQEFTSYIWKKAIMG